MSGDYIEFSTVGLNGLLLGETSFVSPVNSNSKSQVSMDADMFLSRT